MPEPQDLGNPERELADALGGLLPAAPRPAAARAIWYQAGYEAARRRGNRWRAAAGVAALIACVVGVWRPRPAPITVERVVYVRPAAPAAAVATAVPTPPWEEPAGESSSAYLRLRDAVAQHGLAGLPPISAGDGGFLPDPPRHADRPTDDSTSAPL
jgi:hypothetical protein